MNLRWTTPLVSLLGIVWLLPQAARADATYIYTGNPYNLCSGTYATTGLNCQSNLALSISFTVANPLNDDLVSKDISKKLKSLTMTDGGGLDLTLPNAGFVAFEVSTDSGGNITDWSFDVGSETDPDPVTGDVLSYFVLAENSGGGVNRDHSETSLLVPNKKGKLIETTDGIGENDGSGLISLASPTAPGTWTGPGAVTPVPEPPSLALLILGLLALAAWPRLRHAAGQRIFNN